MTDSSLTPHVTVPNTLDYTAVLTGFVRNMCQTRNIDRQKANRLCLAVEEAFLNAVQHGFPEDQESTVTLFFSLQADKATASLRYVGYPLDPGLLPKLPRPGADGSGLGLLFMHTMVDQVEFLNHGAKGQETRLTMHMGVRFAQPDPALLVDTEPQTAERGRIDYVIRALRPEEAVEVARLAYLSYGDTYPYEDIYYPDRVRELNRLGRLKSFVAVANDGEILSHAALAFGEDSGMAELGLAFTRPSRRGLGCMKRLWETLLDEARQMHLYGAFILAVTSHPFTQKCSHGLGFADCALLAAEVPGLRFNKISEAAERESILFECRLFSPTTELTLYPPPRHENMIRALGEKLGVRPRYAHTPANACPPGNGRMRLVTKPAFGTATFVVTEFGADLFSTIQATALHLLINGNAPLFLHVPLNSPHAPALVARLEKEPGWFFAGIVPNTATGFDLVLQHTGKYTLDYTRLAAASEEVSALFAYVRHQDEQARERHKNAQDTARNGNA